MALPCRCPSQDFGRGFRQIVTVVGIIQYSDWYASFSQILLISDITDDNRSHTLLQAVIRIPD